MTQMEKLVALLSECRIPFEARVQPMFNTLQLAVPSFKKMEGDVICHQYSYGGDKGLLEIMGFGEEDARGYLTANEAYLIIDGYLNGND